MGVKIFQIRIDNDPGGWKQGDDQKTLVLALSEEDAIEKFKSENWGSTYDFTNGVLIYGRAIDNENIQCPYVSINNSKLSATEIVFDNFDIIVTDRLKKIDKLLDG